MRDRVADSGWTVYVLRCGDGTFYTGIARDLAKRLAAHERGIGARYTRGRGPFSLVYTEACEDRSRAQIREAAIKRLSRNAKQRLAGDARAAGQATVSDHGREALR